MLLVLKEMDSWLNFLVGKPGSQGTPKDVQYFHHFSQWLYNRKTLFENDPYNEFLIPIYKATQNIVTLRISQDAFGGSGKSNSFWETTRSILEAGAFLAAANEMVKQRRVLELIIKYKADSLREMLSEGDLDNIFDELEEDASNCESDQYLNGFYSIKKRYSDLKFQQLRGIINHDNHTLEMNRITNDILRLIS